MLGQPLNQHYSVKIFTGSALTDWQPASLNFFALQTMKMMEAEEEKADISCSSSLSNAKTIGCRIITNVLTNDSKY